MPDSHEHEHEHDHVHVHDPLRSLFREAASAGGSGSGLPPVSVIARRGERARRHRIAGIAVACCLVIAGSGAALATFLPVGSGPTLPATTPAPAPPSPAPTLLTDGSPTPGPPPATASAGASATTTPTFTTFPTPTGTSTSRPPR
ncbi:hypothetical protein ACFWBN_05390 [Streptomyces sp. NPDC059989]|uniref:hypothetical protein n=1 Tax=Streptomyces sp. NPDC059989 TaxID=3347026 RepID=UPI0036ADA53B